MLCNRKLRKHIFPHTTHSGTGAAGTNKYRLLVDIEWTEYDLLVQRAHVENERNGRVHTYCSFCLVIGTGGTAAEEGIWPLFVVLQLIRINQATSNGTASRRFYLHHQ